MKFFIKCCLLLVLVWSFNTQTKAQAIITVDTIINATCNASADGAIQISVAGVPPFTYQWSNGATTEDVTGLFSGSFVVTVTDGLSGVTVSNVLTVTAPPVINVVADTIINILCAGDSTGSVDLSVSGGVPGYTYIWDNGATTQDVSGLPAGPMNVTVTDANGCTASAKAIGIDSVPPIIVTLDSIDNVTCNGAANGGVFISVTGGRGGTYNYLWSNGATTQNITGLSGGAYSVTVTDSSNCVMLSGPHIVNEPNILAVTFDSLQNVDCNGNGNGAVFITVTGGTANYNFNWSNGATTEDITGLSGGTYSVVVTDANGCVDSTGPHTVNEPAVLTLTLDSIQHIDCNGDADGAVFVTVTGGTTNYTYAWSNSATTQDITGLNGGNYTITVTDANGCTVSDTAYVVNEPPVLVATLDSIVDVSCNGFGDGGVFISVTGGTTNYNFLWSNGVTTEDNPNIGGGSYTVTITDANGCSVTSGPHIVVEPAGMTLTLDSINNVSCNGANDGGVFITVTGGAPNYTYLWSNTATTEDITGLSGGSYIITVTDANGCTVSSGPHVVTEAPALVITLDSIDNVSCNGANDGAVFITATGGTGGYTYAWSNTASSQNITGLGGGSYTVTVTDAAGCTAVSGPHVVTEPTQLVATLDSINNVSCNGLSDGGVFVSITGGTVPFSYLWSNGATTEDATGLIAGSYTLTVTDTNGCTATTGPHIVTEPTALVITLDSIDNVSCNGAADGGVFITATGGTGAYTYAWSNTGSSQNITGLSGGSYTVTVTDANGCTAVSGPHVVTEAPALVITLDSIDNVSCNGANDGAVFITATGGTGGYTYAWSNTASSQNITGLGGGSYTVTVTDAAGCTAVSGPHVVTEPTQLVATLDSINNVSCNGLSDGGVFVSITGGTVPFSYLWSNGATTEDATGLIAGSYTLTVTDTNGCTATTGPHVVTEPTALVITLDSIDNVSCNGAADGGVFITATGGTGAYTYAWSNTGSSQNITGLSGGSYTVTVTDANGCTQTSGPLSVSEPTTLDIVIDSFKNESCFGIIDGFISTTATGGTAPYSYLWNTGATVDDLTNLIAGTYTITVTDTNGCTAIDTVTINDIPTITVTLDGIDSVSCNGLSDGAVSITTTLGAPGYTWLWSTGATTEDLSGVSIGNYTLTVTDALGCTITAGAYTVEEPAILAITLDNSTDVSCNGAADGAVMMTTTGGTSTYTYAWSNGQVTEDITGLSGSSNTVTVTDFNGCTATSGPHIVNEASAIVVTIDNIDSVSCNGAADGAIAISVSGGTPAYSYNWDNGGGTTEDLTNLSGNTYTVTVTDGANCTVTSGPHVVLEPAALNVAITATVPLEGCLGEPFGALDAAASGGTGTATYQWSNSITTASNAGLNTGIYTVTVTDANGCTATAVDSIQDPVRPVVNPFVGQASVTDTTVNWGDIININAGNDQTSNGVNYTWEDVTNLGDVNFGSNTVPATSIRPEPTTSGTYTLLVTATSADGCVDTGSVYVTVNINDLLGIPTAFTPNGDGVNDYFRPANLDPQFIVEYKIYNRWGQLLFDDTNTTNQWDGRFNGVDQPTEVYIYLLRYQVPGQDARILRGEFTLLR
ncbi:T9SS type B sorting domain-containing protein [Aureispira sp. CCB-QB1]|uniref:T9SS type B sorting domain-containing protein n=1 Tax=Aureispira sp. CCB-QB1 TaxID=1313421 RepID=UPI00069804D1|nr:T9SS type B sorting domain-containing protein [Aureispira sp. CCB-QB1]